MVFGQIKNLIRNIPGIKIFYHFINYNIFKRYRIFYVYPLDSFIMSNELVQTKVLDTIETKCYSPKLKHTDHQKEESTILPPVYSIKMKDATVIGGSNIILKDNKALYNHNIGNNVNYSDSAFHDYRKIYKLGRNKIYIPSAQKLNIEKGISFCINYSFNYYHFIFESLSKFQLLEMLDIDTLIPTKNFKNFPQIYPELLGQS